MKTLRPYQEKAVRAFFEYWSHAKGNPLVTAPVGAGKSLILAEFTKQACNLYSGTRIVILSHVAELLVQDAEELLGQWPDAPLGFYSASLGKRNPYAQILFAGIQTIHSKAAVIGHIDLILIDEAHLVSPNGNTMYQRFIKAATEINPSLKVSGVTGTPFRQNQGYLHEGEGRLFTDLVFDIPILYLIENGYLTPVVTPKVKMHMDVAGVPSRGGDYVENKLQEAVDKDEITQACVDDIIEHGRDRKRWLVFCTGVQHANHVAEAICARGITCEVITGDTPKGERADILRRYNTGLIQCIVNVGVLTTGFNSPAIDLIAFMRPTKSPVLYIQMCGRGMRLFPGKENCLVLDFGGIVARLGPIDDVRVKPPKGGGGEAPTKQCPECMAVNHAAVRVCHDCGYEFPEPEPEITQTAARDQAILSNQIEPVWLDVKSVSYKKHNKKDKPPSVQVTYICGLTRHREWVSPENPKAAIFYHRWWSRHSQDPLPKSTAEFLAISDTLPRPTRIMVLPQGEYIRIIAYDFGEVDDGETV